MRIWLDDLRDPLTFDPGPHAQRGLRALGVLQRHGREGWTWVRSVPEALALIYTQGAGIDIVSCDSDLGTGYAQGKTLILWLEEQAFTDPSFPIPAHIYAHTDNDADWANMEAGIQNIRRYPPLV